MKVECPRCMNGKGIGYDLTNYRVELDATKPPRSAGASRKTMRPTSTQLKADLLEHSTKVRRSFETLMGWDSCATALDGQCERMSKSLTAVLVAEGFEARVECGTYFGCDPSYEPSFSDWDEEAIEVHDPSNGYSHYWVVCESVLIDICSDQFHPNQRSQYRVVMEHEDFTNWQSAQ